MRTPDLKKSKAKQSSGETSVARAGLGTHGKGHALARSNALGMRETSGNDVVRTSSEQRLRWKHMYEGIRREMRYKYVI